MAGPIGRFLIPLNMRCISPFDGSPSSRAVFRSSGRQGLFLQTFCISSIHGGQDRPDERYQDREVDLTRPGTQICQEQNLNSRRLARRAKYREVFCKTVRRRGVSRTKKKTFNMSFSRRTDCTGRTIPGFQAYRIVKRRNEPSRGVLLFGYFLGDKHQKVTRHQAEPALN